MCVSKAPATFSSKLRAREPQAYSWRKRGKLISNAAGEEVTTRELVQVVFELCGFEGVFYETEHFKTRTCGGTPEPVDL